MVSFSSACRLERRHTVEKGELLDLHFGAGGFELFLDLFGFFFFHAFFQLGTALFDECFGFGEAETGDDIADFLNYGNLVRTAIDEDHVEFGFLFDGCCRGGTTASGCNGDRSGGANAPLVFEGFHEFCDFQDGKAA